MLAGRRAYERRAWRDAYDALSQANAAGSLAADDVERLAWSAILTGHDERALEAFERLHQLTLDGGEALRAARADPTQQQSSSCRLFGHPPKLRHQQDQDGRDA